MREIRCPECNRTDVTEIIYGYIPCIGSELEKALKEGKARMGGCCIESWSPSHECNACFHSWQDPASG